MRFIIFFLISFNLFAEQTNYHLTYIGNEFGYEAYYSCKYAKEQLLEFAKTLSIKVSGIECSGGLVDVFQKPPIELDAKVEYLGNSGDSIEIKSDLQFSACPLNTMILDELISKVPDYRISLRTAECKTPRSLFYYFLKKI